MIPLAEPTLGNVERRYVQECLDSGFVSSVGPFVERFEHAFARVIGTRHAVACSSGTAALHVALRLAGAGPGTQVALSDFTFIASANAVSYTGADLLLVDSERDTWNMNTEMLYDTVRYRARTGRRIPDIVEVVHVLGHPARMEPLLELRAEFGIRIVEDAAESLGAAWVAGKPAPARAGAIGDFGCFSFNGNKLITTGGGGMITTDDTERAAMAKHLTTQANTAGKYYVHDTVGYNYRLTNVAAALGLGQLERLDDLLAAKREISARYGRALHGLPASPPPHAPWADPTFWLYSVLLNDASSTAAVVACLEGAGVHARPLWPPLHLQAPYRDVERLAGETAEELHGRGVSLPSSAHLSERDQERVVVSLRAALNSTHSRHDSAV
ncbi:LegC family aminotransferase [Amycolatopsis tucumanensis]|uniref:LegC family aminotransferase n=1 Tax=Amycolatopsis tucumanensis TaxID=401106 RepID=A0ABP7I3T2_9PSEU